MVYVQYLVLITISTLALSSSNEEYDGQLLRKYFDSLMNDQLGLSMMQKHVELLQFQQRHYSGGTVVKQAVNLLEKKLSQLDNEMQSVLDELHDHEEIVDSSMKSLTKFCCIYSSEKTFYDGQKFQSNIYLEDKCSSLIGNLSYGAWRVPKSVIRIMDLNFQKFSYLDKQHFITKDGTFTLYPAGKETCINQNRHYRKSWFQQILSSMKKHVVILLDTSYSMSHTHNSKTLLKIAVDAIEFLLDSMLPNTEVDIVAFNNSAIVSHICENTSNAHLNFVQKNILKKRFLSELTTGGQSHYLDGFQRAFQLLAMKANNITADTEHRAILLISDGGASETFNNATHQIFQAISKGNKLLRNYVRIFSFGVGRSGVNMDLLERLAKQDFHLLEKKQQKNEVLPGVAFRVLEPDNLGYLLQSFYYYLDEQHFLNVPVLSPPYFDSDGSEIKVTSVVHLYDNQTGTDAFLAADVSIKELTKNEFHIDGNHNSHFFVIDKDGFVLSHPVLSNLGDLTYKSGALNIGSLLQLDDSEDLVSEMKSGYAGQKSIQLKEKPSGMNLRKHANLTYYWNPVSGTDLIICLVKETSDQAVSIVPEYAILGCTGKANEALPTSLCHDVFIASFQYHKFSEYRDAEICEYFSKASTVQSSVVKFSPQSYKSASRLIEYAESSTLVKAYNTFFNELLNASSFVAAKDILRNEKFFKYIHDSLHSDVIPDALWTARADTIWMKDFQTRFVRRFVATKSGVIRIFPGTQLPSYYDHQEREWYQSTVSQPGWTLFSTPYEDVAGAGLVVTISQAITIPYPDKSNNINKVMAVMGLDLHPFSLETIMMDLYPKCADEWKCAMVNQHGYILHHVDQKSTSPEHLISNNGDVVQLLLREGLMMKVSCFDLAVRKFQISYEIQHGTKLNTMNSRNVCARYLIQHITNTNVFFLARERHDSCYYKTCMGDNYDCFKVRECIHASVWPNSHCECPCTVSSDNGVCAMLIQDHPGGRVFCNNPTIYDTLPDNFCANHYIKPCFGGDTCRNQTNPLKCATVKQCVWCATSQEQSFCEGVQACYEKTYGLKFTGKEGMCIGRNKDEENFPVIIVTVTLFGAITLLILVGLLLYCNRFCQRKESYHFPQSARAEFEENLGGDIVTAITWNEMRNDGNTDAVDFQRNVKLNLKARIYEQNPTIRKIVEITDDGESTKENNVSKGTGDGSGTSLAGTTYQRTRPRKRYRNPDDKNSAIRNPPVARNLDDTLENSLQSSRPPRKIQGNEKSPSSGLDSKKDRNKPIEQTNAVKKLFRSVLKRRADIRTSDVIYMENISTRLSSESSYFKMFAEPGDNEGDIPIIQSDNSDSGSLRNMSVTGNFDSQRS